MASKWDQATKTQPSRGNPLPTTTTVIQADETGGGRPVIQPDLPPASPNRGNPLGSGTPGAPPPFKFGA